MYLIKFLHAFSLKLLRRFLALVPFSFVRVNPCTLTHLPFIFEIPSSVFTCWPEMEMAILGVVVYLSSRKLLKDSCLDGSTGW